MSAQGITLRASGMHCSGCEGVIENTARRLPGVRRVKADYPTETVSLIFDPAATTLKEVCAAIGQKGYRCLALDEAPAPRNWPRRLAAATIGVLGVICIILLDVRFISEGGAPDVSRHMGYGLIFTLGLLTGFHCVGMCGGFVLSYSARDAALGRPAYWSHGRYAIGKTLSYAGVGAMFGLLGAVVTFTPLLRGAAGIGAGVLVIIFGLNMLGLFAPLRKIRLKLPTTLGLFRGASGSGLKGPLGVGVLNGFNIACGPLQAMYVMAAGTGSAVEGAKMLFVFGVGTLPVMLGFGFLTSLISGALTHRLLRASGVILILLGAVMINRGLILTGSGYDLGSLAPAVISAKETAPLASVQDAGVQTIDMDVTQGGYSQTHFVLRKGVPVRWRVDGKEITTCNHRIVAPKLGLEFDVKEGPQVIEFTPTEAGVIPWSCWMGMLRGEFEVIDGPASAEPAAAQANVAPALNEPAAAQANVAPALKEPAAAQAERAQPAAFAMPAPAAAPPPTYRIAKGDALARIAKKLYHDAGKWRDIAEVNPGLDPARLHLGQMINLPSEATKR